MKPDKHQKANKDAKIHVGRSNAANVCAYQTEHIMWQNTIPYISATSSNNFWSLAFFIRF